jgi:hypothetical protein
MPTNDDLDIQDDSARADDDGMPPAATPSFNIDDVKTMIKETVGGIMNEAVNRARQQQRPAQAAPIEPTPDAASDEDYAENVGNAVRKDLRRMEHGLRQTFNEFAQLGMERLGSLTQQQMRTQLPYYEKYEAEINSELGQLRPELRTDPTTIRLVHDSVAMRHDHERLEDARKESSRQARGDAPAPSGNTGRGKVPEQGTPTPEDLGFNADQIDDINARGGPDAFAQKISNGRFANWKEYAEASGKRATAPRKGRGNIIPFLRSKVAGGRVIEDGDILTGPAHRKKA